VFGPLKFQPEVAVDEDEEDEEESEPEPEVDEVENPKKRAVERQHHHELTTHGSPAKRQRLSHGYENGADSATTPMEIDHHPDNNHAYPSPLEGEQVESPLLRTEGPSRGTQVDKVRDLTQGTVFLRLGADESSEASENPLVLLCEWNPRDPSILATAGTDALARIWTIPCGTGPDPDAGHVGNASPSFMSIVEEDLPKNATVSAMSWSSSGDLIALGTELGNKSRVSIWSVDGTSMHRFDGLDSPVTNLCWSPNNNFLLAISPDVSNGASNPGTLLHISSPSMVNSMSHVLEHDLRSDNLDATWISETEFLLCGGDLLVSFRCTEQGIVQGREFQTAKDERFSLVEFDWRSRVVATASEKGYIDVSVIPPILEINVPADLFCSALDLGRIWQAPFDPGARRGYYQSEVATAAGGPYRRRTAAGIRGRRRRHLRMERSEYREQAQVLHKHAATACGEQPLDDSRRITHSRGDTRQDIDLEDGRPCSSKGQLGATAWLAEPRRGNRCRGRDPVLGVGF
jgi:hypothetical protein